MAVLRTRLVSSEGGHIPDGTRSYTSIYEVDTDDVNDGPITARTAAGLPDRGDEYTYGNDLDVGSTLKTKVARLVKVRDSYKTWRVTCSYDGSTEGTDVEDASSPLDFRTRWSGSYVQFLRDYMQDKDGTAIKNAAGDPYVDPPVQGDDSRLSIVAIKNFSSLSVSTWAQFRDAVNNGTWWGLSARKLKVQSITWEQDFFNKIPFYTVRFEFHVNDSTWDVTVLNAGYYELNSGNCPRVRIQDKLGRDVNQPVPLTTAGAVMNCTAIAADGETYNTFKLYTEKDFSLLGLPSVLGAA